MIKGLRTICLAALAWMPLSGMGAENVDRVVAVVEEQVITQSEVDEAAAPYRDKLKKKGVAADFAKVEKEVLEELILKRLRDKEAERIGIKVTEEDYAKGMAKVEKQNGLPPGSLPKTLAKEGIALADFKRQLRDQIIDARIVGRVIRPMITVTNDELEDVKLSSEVKEGLLDEIRVAQILVPLSQDAGVEEQKRVKKKMEELQARLKKGDSFETVARQYSTHKSASAGGDMGWFRRGQLAPQMEEALFKLDKGEALGPVRTPEGVHIFLLMDRRASASSDGGSSSGGGQEVRVRHILIQDGPTTPPESEVLAKLKKLKEQVEDGEDFAKLAKLHSQDTSASSGGEIGWISPGMADPEFERAAFALEKGQLSEPVHSQFGWHLILVEEKRSRGDKLLAGEKAKLEAKVREAKVEARYQQWKRELRQKAFVEYR